MENPQAVDIEIHSLDDWEAIYVNGVSQYQAHSGVLEWWFQNMAEMPITIRSLKRRYRDDLDPDMISRLPDTLDAP